MPRPRRSSRTSRPRRSYAWNAFSSDPANVNPAGVAAHSLLGNFNAEQRGGATLVRLIGDVRIWPGDASNITEGFMGISPVDAEANAAGAFPEPATDTSARWLWWKRFFVGTQATGELGTGLGENFHFDLKMRVLLRDRLMTVQLLVENDDGTHTFLVGVGVRALLQLA